MVTIEWDGGQLEVDASPTQTHEREAAVTEHPVETGGVVVDHVRQQPRSLKISGVIEDRDAAYATLNRLMETAALLTVRTSLETYQGVVLSALSVPRDAAAGDALQFSATFRRIVFAESQRVEVKKPPRAKVNRGSQTTKDTKATAPATAAKIEIPGKSVAKRALSWVGSLAGGG